MKKWFQKATAVILAAILLIGQAVSAGAAGAGKQEETLKIASLSDTHYLSPDLIKNTEDFTEHLNSDRKMFAESDAFLTALLDTIKEDDPDVLLISGDLTKDGEKEGHEELAAKLEAFRKEEMPDLHIYITPGNHDLNNSNAMNFNTEDGVAVPAGRTTQQDYMGIYADLTYNDETVIAKFQPKEGKQGGGLSYVARPKDGFSVISIDSARYSADNTDSGTDEHETSGAISADLEKWVVEQITAAKKRGDTVIGLQHHGLVPHFSMEPDLLPMYLVNDYERISKVFADAGMQYIFTGHMHANDISAMTTEKGSILYDIETGSVVTYPSPARVVNITRTVEAGTVSEAMDVKTYTGVGPITFENPATGENQTIEDISAYGQKHGFSNDMLTTTLNGFLHGYYDQIAATGSKAAVETLLGDLLGDSLPGSGNFSIEQILNIALPLLITETEPTEGADFSVYFKNGAVRINWKGENNGLRLELTPSGIADTLDYVFSTADEMMEDRTVLDGIVKALVEDLTSIKVSDDKGTDKTLLDYVNYIYQSHLGGEDSGTQPTWVTDARAYLDSGDLTDDLINLVIKHVVSIVNTLLDEMPVSEFTGITGANDTFTDLAADPDRDPLITATNANGKSILAFAFLLIGAYDEQGNFPADYSMKDLLDDAGSLLGQMGVKDFSLDLETLLTELINGTPATETAPAKEGLLTEEIRRQLTGLAQSVVESMGTDSNYPQDNDTSITYKWKLLTNRTALDTAIAEAEKLDLTQYTEETAKAVTNALTAAKGISQTATQEQMDHAAKTLSDAVNALKKVEVSEQPGTPDAPDSPDLPGNIPQTGDSASGLPFILLIISCSGLLAVTALSKRMRAQKQ